LSEGVQGLVTPMTAAIFAVTFLLLWKRDPARRETLAMGIGYVSLSIGFFMSHLNPESLGRVNISVTNIPYSIGTIVLIWGILHRAGIRLPIFVMGSIAVIGAIVGGISQVFGDSVEADLYIANTTYGLMFGVAALLLSQKTKTDVIEKIVLGILIFNVAQFFLRPPLSFMFSEVIVGGAYRDATYYAILMTVLALGSMVMGLALIAGCIKDQLNALHTEFATDMLSGLLSRHAFEARARETIAAAHKDNVPLALIIGDIDHFKQVNDIWGHQVGDNAIEGFGKLVLHTVRDTDICGRIGGEEFCILVWNADSKVARSLAERLRIGVTAIEISGMNDDTHLTASFGGAGMEVEEGYRSLFARADKALYRAKDAGRNAVEIDDNAAVSHTRRSDDEPRPITEGAGTSKAA